MREYDVRVHHVHSIVEVLFDERNALLLLRSEERLRGRSLDLVLVSSCTPGRGARAIMLAWLRLFRLGIVFVFRKLGGGLLERNGAEADGLNFGGGDEGEDVPFQSLLRGLSRGVRDSVGTTH